MSSSVDKDVERAKPMHDIFYEACAQVLYDVGEFHTMETDKELEAKVKAQIHLLSPRKDLITEEMKKIAAHDGIFIDPYMFHGLPPNPRTVEDYMKAYEDIGADVTELLLIDESWQEDLSEYMGKLFTKRGRSSSEDTPSTSKGSDKTSSRPPLLRQDAMKSSQDSEEPQFQMESD